MAPSRPIVLADGGCQFTSQPEPQLAGVRICMVGLRGVPDVQGGIEKHVEQLALNLINAGADVHVYARSRYVPKGGRYIWNGVTVHPLWAPRKAQMETLVHTFLALIHARSLNPDIVHVHGVGPSLLTPLARLLGLRVVFTHHGFDYNREKWSRFAKFTLRAGERIGVRFSHARIAVAQNIANDIKERYATSITFVPNGVAVCIKDAHASVLEDYGLEPKRYIACIGRLVPEKRQADLIRAFALLNKDNMKLAIIGSGDPASAYGIKLREMAAATPGVVLTGRQSGEKLAGLFLNARLFVLPSSHEGMPIALLEALAYGVPVLASNIEANLAIGLKDESYFPVGGIQELARAMRARLADETSQANAIRDRDHFRRVYSWKNIADQTARIYKHVLNPMP